jgi:DedD protein
MAKAQSTRSRTAAAESEDAAVDPALPQKKRARHRLIGAVTVCLVAATVVPMLLEPEPARKSPELNVVIPPRDTPVPTRGVDSRPEAGRKPESASGTRLPDASLAEVVPVVPKPMTAKPVEPRSDSGRAPEAKRDSGKSEGDRAKVEPAKGSTAKVDAPKADAPKADAQRADASKADASKADAPKSAASKAEGGKGSASKSSDITAGRYAVQVGAFSSQASASAAVDKVRETGVKVYTETVKTERGERIRVRVGPFASREAAEDAREKLKAAGLNAALIAPQ